LSTAQAALVIKIARMEKRCRGDRMVQL